MKLYYTETRYISLNCSTPNLVFEPLTLCELSYRFGARVNQDDVLLKIKERCWWKSYPSQRTYVKQSWTRKRQETLSRQITGCNNNNNNDNDANDNDNSNYNNDNGKKKNKNNDDDDDDDDEDDDDDDDKDDDDDDEGGGGGDDDDDDDNDDDGDDTRNALHQTNFTLLKT